MPTRAAVSYIYSPGSVERPTLHVPSATQLHPRLGRRFCLHWCPVATAAHGRGQSAAGCVPRRHYTVPCAKLGPPKSLTNSTTLHLTQHLEDEQERGGAQVQIATGGAGQAGGVACSRVAAGKVVRLHRCLSRGGAHGGEGYRQAGRRAQSQIWSETPVARQLGIWRISLQTIDPVLLLV